MISSTLYRLGVAMTRHRRKVLIGWGLVLALCIAVAPSLQQALGPPNYVVEGSESQHVEQLLARRFTALGTEDDAVVFYSPHHFAAEPAYRREVAVTLGMVRQQDGVGAILSPYDPRAVGQISSDEHAAVAAVVLDGSARQRYAHARTIQREVLRMTGNGMHVWLTGFSPLTVDLSKVNETDVKRAEAIGIPIALVILVLAMGTLMTAALPLLLAFVGLLLAYGLLAVLATAAHFDTLLVSIVTMIGLGFGIDYALFVVSRFREEFARGNLQHGTEEDRIAGAVGTALATSGSAVVLSGLVVAVSFASLAIVKGPFFKEMAIANMIVVFCQLMVTLTLLPAVLAVLCHKLDWGRLPASLRREGASLRGRRTREWVTAVTRRPILAAAIAVVLLMVATLPLLNLRLGVNVGVLSLASTPSGSGEKVLARSFSPGAVGPIEIVIAKANGRPLTRTGLDAGQKLVRELERSPQVTGVDKLRDNGGMLLAVVPAIPIDTPSASALVSHIRNDLAPAIRRRQHVMVLVGGATAFAADFTAELHVKLLTVLALILSLSFVCLVIAFRSVAIPIKAVLMTLLSTGATLGLTVLVFQDGHGEHVLGFTNPGFIQAFLPLIVFALIFGLSMDYEVLMVRRMQEVWSQTHDNQTAVVSGTERAARPIIAAAAIMFAVFGCFITANILEIKQLGFALATAVALDATVVRLVLVPAVMCVMGAWNWRLPSLLVRVLPKGEFERYTEDRIQS
jgi:putative drug exporter of the RND superfamily